MFDVGEDLHLGLYMVMELLKGEELARTIAASKGLRPDDAAAIAWQVCLALERAHAAGVVHRDLKSANVFLVRADDGSTKVKVLDFGIAKLLRDANEALHGALTRAGMAVGTPQYMSPEQAQGLASIDHRTDVYSLGALLFEAVAGAAPYPDDEPYERDAAPHPHRADAAPERSRSRRAAGARRARRRDDGARSRRAPRDVATVRARLAAMNPRVRKRTFFLGRSHSVDDVPASVAPPPRTASAIVVEAPRRSTMRPAARRATTAVLVALGAMVVASLAIALFVARTRPASSAPPETASGAPAEPSNEPAIAPAPPSTGLAAIESLPPVDLVAEAQRALERGDPAHARALAVEAIRRASDDAEAWLTLGAAHEALGDVTAARGAYQSCVSVGRGDRVRECSALLAR